MAIQQLQPSQALRSIKPATMSPVLTIGQMEAQRLGEELTVEKMRAEIQQMKDTAAAGQAAKTKQATIDAILAKGLPIEETYAELAKHDLGAAEKYATMARQRETDQRAEAIKNAELMQGQPGAQVNVPMPATQERAIPQSLDPEPQAQRTTLGPDEESAFQSWYQGWARKAGLDPNPDSLEHKYDYRGAYKAGYSPEINPSDGQYHWPSPFKDPDHPNRFVGGMDTLTGKPAYRPAPISQGSQTVELPHPAITIPSRFGPSMKIQVPTRGQVRAETDQAAEETARRTRETQRAQQQAEAEFAPPVKPPTPTGIAGEYEYAKTQGYKGTFEQYQNEDANRKKPAAPTGATSGPGDWTKTGDEFLETIPAQWRTTVKKVAHYDEDPTKVASMRGGMREQLMQWVNQVNPAYNSVLYGNLAPARKAFTLGTQGQQINAINTAIGHIDQITKLGAALENGNFVKGNQFYNWAKTAFGEDAVTNFDTLKDALAGEIASVLSKGSATVSGIAEAKEKIHAASSPKQLAGYVKTLIPVMGSKLNALDYEYQQATGGNDPTFSALSTEAKAILRHNGIDPDRPLDGASPASSAGDGQWRILP